MQFLIVVICARNLCLLLKQVYSLYCIFLSARGGTVCLILQKDEVFTPSAS